MKSIWINMLSANMHQYYKQFADNGRLSSKLKRISIMATHECTKEMFLKGVSRHKINILLDNGVYRHIRFAEPRTNNAYFDLVTWPGFLSFSGDMGTYSFSRIPDMFDFFCDGIKEDGDIGINPGYWGEKLQSESRFGNGASQFSKDEAYDNIRYGLKMFIQDERDSFSRKKLRTKVQQVVEDLIHVDWENEYEVRDAVANYDGDVFCDAWEWTYTRATYHYIWCLYAIVWGIKTYREHLAAEENLILRKYL